MITSVRPIFENFGVVTLLEQLLQETEKKKKNLENNCVRELKREVHYYNQYKSLNYIKNRL